MAEKPTGFVARCRCGALTGVLDRERTHPKEIGPIFGKWLMTGHTVEPRFGGSWSVTLEACRCPTLAPEPHA